MPKDFYASLKRKSAVRRAKQDDPFGKPKKHRSKNRKPKQSQKRSKPKPCYMTEMPFGKWKGCRFKDVPLSYLRWLVDNCELRKELRVPVLQEIKSKFAEFRAAKNIK